MGRRRIYQHHSIPGSVVLLVQAVVQDYPRRKRIIEYSGATSTIVEEECAKLNRIIEDVVNGDERLLSIIILEDIFRNIGYRKSEATSIASKNLYYSRKCKIIEDIARNCNFL